MSIRSLLHATGIFLSLGIGLFFHTHTVIAETNLLTNPGAESGGAGWTTISDFGDGMSYNFDGVVRSGSQSFQTSFGLDSIYQKVDLFANGFSTSSLNAYPPITISVWVASRGDQAIQYYAKFSLLQQDGSTVVTSADFGTSGSLLTLPAGTDWTEIRYTFQNYDPGVRYAYIEFGGRDQSGWAGNYGAHFDDASVSVSPVTASQSSSGGGGSSMPGWGFVPPRGPFIIGLHDSTSTITSASDVLLDISTSSDVDRMALSRYADFHDSGIISLNSSILWSVCGQPTCAPGNYDLYAKFYQAYGVASSPQHLVITYLPEEVSSDNSQTPVITAGSTSTIPSSTIVDDSVPSITLFTRNLRPGDSGDDIKLLQEFMNTHGYVLAEHGPGSPGSESTVFGPALRRALIRLQEDNPEKLLLPLGLKKGTGFFGTQTRRFVNEYPVNKNNYLTSNREQPSS